MQLTWPSGEVGPGISMSLRLWPIFLSALLAQRITSTLSTVSLAKGSQLHVLQCNSGSSYGALEFSSVNPKKS